MAAFIGLVLKMIFLRILFFGSIEIKTQKIIVNQINARKNYESIINIIIGNNLIAFILSNHI